MHRRGTGTVAALGIALAASIFSARSASAALLTLDDVTLPGDPVQVVSGADDAAPVTPNPPAAEGAANAIDNTTNKYLNFQDYGSGFIVTPSRGPSIVRVIRLYTANDAPERDPSSFLLEGSTTGANGPFTVIYGSTVTLPGNRNATAPAGSPGTPIDPNTQNFVDVGFANTTAYTAYRVTFPTLRDGVNANAMQIGEVELLGTVVPEPATLGLLSLGALGLLRRRR
jgi:hypothetical protein